MKGGMGSDWRVGGAESGGGSEPRGGRGMWGPIEREETLPENFFLEFSGFYCFLFHVNTIFPALQAPSLLFPITP